ncbi:MAG: hypothetical protein FJ304_06525 [Planctomycetes bacterium]|nr:hypothetical protein [Planctomycetota bacterium]
MSRFRWGVAAALALGASAVSGAEPTTGTDARPWYKRMFSSGPAPVQVGPTVRTGAGTAVPTRAPTTTLTPEIVADAVKAEYVAWERRMSVCNELRRVAYEKNDEALVRQVEELERQVNATYQQRVSALGVPKVKAPLPVAPGTGFAASFDLAPEKPLDPKAAAARLAPPTAPVPVGTAEVKVKP